MPRPTKLNLVILFTFLLVAGEFTNIYLAHRNITPLAQDTVLQAPLNQIPVGKARWPATPSDDDWPNPTRQTTRSLRFLDSSLSSTLNASRQSDEQSYPIYVMTSFRSGWPLRTLQIHNASTVDINDNWTRYPPTGFTKPRYLAAGLIINPFVYALPIWISIVLFFMTKHALTQRSRTRNNRCLQCAYDITNLSQCPECGQDSPPRG